MSKRGPAALGWPPTPPSAGWFLLEHFPGEVQRRLRLCQGCAAGEAWGLQPCRAVLPSWPSAGGATAGSPDQAP